VELDFRFNHPLDERVVSLFEKIANSCRPRYNDIIRDSSVPHMSCIDWWCESVSSRNTYASPLFHYICSIELLKTILIEGLHEPTKVISDSRELSKIFQKIADEHSKDNIEIIYKINFLDEIKVKIKDFYYEWFILLRALRVLVTRIFFRTKINLHIKESVVLIDTFITSSYIHEDRWYGSFWENLDEDLQRKVFFVPTIVDTSFISFLNILKGLISSSRNFILKEEYLTFNDLLDAYFHKYRVKKLKPGKSILEGLEITALVNECLLSNRDVNSTIEALLTYSFLKKLSFTSLEVRLAIDWFEGHSLDKMWNLGVHEFFPKSKRIAYETFRSFPYYLSTFPTLTERESHTIPETFAVQGPACIEGIKEFLPDLDVISVPAFKNQHVWENENALPFDDKVVLVAFPISLKTSIQMIEILIKNSKLNDLQGVSYILKSHPVNSNKDIESKLRVDLPSSFKFTEERSFPDLLIKSSILVTEASSVCLESFAFGKPVIIIENSSGLTYDPVPSDIPSALFKKCSSLIDISEALNNFLTISKEQLIKNIDLGKQIRNNYFERVTKEGINRFLDINK
jgi:hypothetical protein